MKTKNIIEGLTILDAYREDTDGYNTGAEHDKLYAYATDTPLDDIDLAKMVKLGWFQEEANLDDDEDGDGDFHECHYDSNESWTAFV